MQIQAPTSSLLQELNDIFFFPSKRLHALLKQEGIYPSVASALPVSIIVIYLIRKAYHLPYYAKSYFVENAIAIIDTKKSYTMLLKMLTKNCNEKYLNKHQDFLKYLPNFYQLHEKIVKSLYSLLQDFEDFSLQKAVSLDRILLPHQSLVDENQRKKELELLKNLSLENFIRQENIFLYIPKDHTQQQIIQKSYQAYFLPFIFKTKLIEKTIDNTYDVQIATKKKIIDDQQQDSFPTFQRFYCTYPHFRNFFQTLFNSIAIVKENFLRNPQQIKKVYLVPLINNPYINKYYLKKHKKEIFKLIEKF